VLELLKVIDQLIEILLLNLLWFTLILFSVPLIYRIINAVGIVKYVLLIETFLKEIFRVYKVRVQHISVYKLHYNGMGLSKQFRKMFENSLVTRKSGDKIQSVTV